MVLDDKLKTELMEIFKNKDLSLENIIDINNIIKKELGIKEKRPVA